MRVWIATVLLSVSVPAGFAQFDQGQIAGTVKDGSDAIVVQAQVSAVNAQNGQRSLATTGGNGSYILTNLPVGYYEISIQAGGFKKFVQSNVKVDAATRTTVDATLQIGLATETVNVIASATMLERETAQIGRIVESKQITDIALNGRNPIKLAILKAGVVGGNNFNDFGPTQLHEQFSINGGRRAGNNVTIDGVNAMRTRGDWNGTAELGMLNADALQEVQILSSTYPAEYGHGMDGQIRFVSKSGTQDLHGTFYEFLRNSALDANSWVRNRSPLASDNRRPAPFRFNQPGYAVGGPIYLPKVLPSTRDKLFFFASQEWLIFRQEKTGTATVPTAAMQRGDFSELLSPTNTFFGRTRLVNDPLSSAPFPGNIIPPTRLSPNGVGILKSYPLPVTGFLQGTDNWIQTRPNPRDSRKDSIRVDYYLNQKTRLNFSGTHFTYHEDDPFAPTGPLDRSNSRWDRPNMTGMIGLTSTLSPTKVNEFSISGANDVVRIGIFPQDGQPLYLRSQYGINFPYIVAGQKRIPDRIPQVSITGFATVDGSTRPTSSSGPIFALNDNFTWIKNSAHSLKFGVSLEYAQQNNNDQIGIQNGVISFLDTGNPRSSGVAVANLALGNFDNYIERGPAAYTLLRSRGLEVYAQDTWKATSNLTFEIGVRYSNFQPWYAKWNDIANFDPAFFNPKNAAVVDPAGGFLLSGDPYNGIVLPGTGFPDSAKGRAYGATVPGVDRLFHYLPRGLVNYYQNAFAPRFGVAYRPGNKTVIRTGAGIFHHRQMQNQNALLRNAPNQIEVSVQNGFLDDPGGNAKTYPYNFVAMSKDARIPTAYSYSVSIQHELPSSIVLDVSYVGKTAVNQERTSSLNNLSAGTLQRNPGISQAALRPFAGLGTINWTTRDGRVDYNSLQVTIDKRFHSGLSFGLAYTFSKSLSDLMNLLSPSQAYDPTKFVRALDELDRKHVLNANFIYELPIFRRSTGLIRTAVGGWQLSGVYFRRSGAPLSVVTTVDVAGVGVGAGPQPYNVSGSTAVDSQGIGSRWFNTAAFTRPAPGTFGNAGLGLIRGPGFQNLDLALFKDLKVRERLSAQVRIESFNLPNHPILNNPGTDPLSGTFGLITSKFNQRNLQLGLKFRF
ncbi:MAG: hypothetical protein QOJ99_5080 [Bryobacterales bacterium]|nr:hypothetical protein [Bryobacterales bacterium]